MEQYPKHKFKQGEEVAHIDNLQQKMNIERLVKSAKTVDNGTEKLNVSYLQYIRCHWWAKGGDYVVGMFHSRELVPYDIAQEGFMEVMKWQDAQRNAQPIRQ